MLLPAALVDSLQTEARRYTDQELRNYIEAYENDRLYVYEGGLLQQGWTERFCALGAMGDLETPLGYGNMLGKYGGGSIVELIFEGWVSEEFGALGGVPHELRRRVIYSTFKDELAARALDEGRREEDGEYIPSPEEEDLARTFQPEVPHG